MLSVCVTKSFYLEPLNKLFCVMENYVFIANLIYIIFLFIELSGFMSAVFNNTFVLVVLLMLNAIVSFLIPTSIILNSCVTLLINFTLLVVVSVDFSIPLINPEKIKAFLGYLNDKGLLPLFKRVFLSGLGTSVREYYIIMFFFGIGYIIYCFISINLIKLISTEFQLHEAILYFELFMGLTAAQMFCLVMVSHTIFFLSRSIGSNYFLNREDDNL